MALVSSCIFMCLPEVRVESNHVVHVAYHSTDLSGLITFIFACGVRYFILH